MVELRRDARARSVVAAVGLAVATLGHAPDARACTPPPPARGEPCTQVRVWVPGAAFPLNLADDHIRISFESFDGLTFEQVPLDRPPQLTVGRASAEGFEVVEHAFGDTGFQLADPSPGRYVLVSTDHTCAAEPAEFAAGGVVADFVLTEAADLPVELGVAGFKGRTVPNEPVVVGVGADCREIVQIDSIPRYHFELELNDQTLPWRDALRFGIEVDGEIVVGFGPGSFVAPSTVVYEHRDTCDGEQYSLTAGTHEFRFVGQVDNVIVASSAASFDCEAIEEPNATSPQGIAGAAGAAGGAGAEGSSGAPGGAEAGACSVARRARGHTVWAFLAFALVGVLAVRRRARSLARTVRRTEGFNGKPKVGS